MTELVIPLATFFGMWPTVLAALILLRFTGVLPLSQGMVGGAIVLVLYLSTSLSPWAAAPGVLAVLLLIGGIHLGLLYYLRPAAFLIASAAIQIVFEQLWLLAPEVTGGSGGLVYEAGALTWLLAIVAPTSCIGLSAVISRLALPHWDAAARTVAALGPVSGAFGVNHRVLTGAAVILWTSACAIWGLLTTASSGIIALSNFDFGWSLVGFLVAILSATKKRPIAWSAALTLTFVILRSLLTAASGGSFLLANIFDIAFPLCILLIILTTKGRYWRPGASDSPL